MAFSARPADLTGFDSNVDGYLACPFFILLIKCLIITIFTKQRDSLAFLSQTNYPYSMQAFWSDVAHNNFSKPFSYCHHLLPIVIPYAQLTKIFWLVLVTLFAIRMNYLSFWTLCKSISLSSHLAWWVSTLSKVFVFY